MYKEYVSPVLDQVDSERMHVLARESLHWAEITPLTLKLVELFGAEHKRFSDERLHVVLGGIELENPTMVGAGWDKAGRAVEALHRLGFSGVEVGSVLAYPQYGNEKPRQFMVGPGVAMNHLGFNGPGMEVVAKNLDRYSGKEIPIGISVGKNKLIPDKAAPEMHAAVITRLYDYASYFVINVSSPNTPNLRALQNKRPLTDIVQAANAAMDARGGRKPMFVKLAPETNSADLNDCITVIVDNGLTGAIVSNTIISSDIKAKYITQEQNERDHRGYGGLSGDDPDFRRHATERVAFMHKESGGQIEIIGVGGVKDAQTALEKITAGARVIQIVTAIRGEGPGVAGRINRGIVAFMEQEGINSLEEIRGSNADNYHLPVYVDEYYPDSKINPVYNRLLVAEMPKDLFDACEKILLIAPTDDDIRKIRKILGMSDDLLSKE